MILCNIYELVAKKEGSPRHSRTTFSPFSTNLTNVLLAVSHALFLSSESSTIGKRIGKDFEFFINELQRITSKGYIELPSRLGDNLVFENKYDHIWWFRFDDLNNELIASKKNQLIEPFLTVSTGKLFEKIFRESLVIELAWDKKIDYQIDNSLQQNNIKTERIAPII